MPHPCLWKQPAAAACLEDAYGKVDILAETHLRESSETQIDIAADTHVERAWIEFVEFLLSSAYSAGGEEARHRVADGFLCLGERLVCPVGTAESVGRLSQQFVVHSLQIAFGQNHVGVEHNEVFALCPLGTVVSALSWS